MARFRAQDGWSLLEVMITLFVIGVLAAIFVPQWSPQQKRANAQAASAQLDVAASTLGTWAQQNVSSAPDAAPNQGGSFQGLTKSIADRLLNGDFKFTTTTFADNGDIFLDPFSTTGAAPERSLLLRKCLDHYFASGADLCMEIVAQPFGSATAGFTPAGNPGAASGGATCAPSAGAMTNAGVGYFCRRVYRRTDAGVISQLAGAAKGTWPAMPNRNSG